MSACATRAERDSPATSSRQRHRCKISLPARVLLLEHTSLPPGLGQWSREAHCELRGPIPQDAASPPTQPNLSYTAEPEFWGARVTLRPLLPTNSSASASPSSRTLPAPGQEWRPRKGPQVPVLAQLRCRAAPPPNRSRAGPHRPRVMTRFLPSLRSRAVRSRSPSALVPRLEPAAAAAAEAAAGAERSPGARGEASCTPGQALCNETVNASLGKAHGSLGFSSLSSCMHVAWISRVLSLPTEGKCGWFFSSLLHLWVMPMQKKNRKAPRFDVLGGIFAGK